MTRKKLSKKQAKKQVEEYFAKAKEVFNKKPELSNDYVRKARKIAMKYRMKLPKELKRKFCKHCYSYLVIGKNARSRTRKGKVVISCFNCKKFIRIPFVKEIKKRRKLLIK